MSGKGVHMFKGVGVRFADFISFLYPPQTLFVVGILFSRCPSVRNILFP